MTAMQYTMKDSGVPWIGDVPEHWGCIRARFVFQDNKDGIRVGPFGSALTNAVVSSEEGTVKIYGQANLIRKDFGYGKNYVTEKTYRELKEYEVLPNDVAISMMGTIGKCCVVPAGIQKGIMDSHLIKIRLNDRMLPSFFEYLYESQAVFEQLLVFSKGSIMSGLNSSIVKRVLLTIPPIEEQKAIAAYLDEKCGAIDGIIAEAKMTIEEYKAWKASVIFEAVTKGLDPHAEMKDSGVEWIGMMPKHWDVCKLKFLCSMQAGKNLTTEDIQETGLYPVYGGNGLRGYYSEYNHESESLLVGRQGALCGNVHRVHGKYWATEHAVVTQPLAIVEIDFLYYLLIGMNLNQYASDAAAQPGLSVGIIRNIPVVLLPKNEQISIAAYLDRRCSAIDGIIAEKQSLIDDLEAYKKSLIFETVTGKRRVFQEGAAI